MTALAYYRQICREQAFKEDPEQLRALVSLDLLSQKLRSENLKRNSFLAALRKPRLVRGLYLWGKVGIGKTFLMDCFYESLPVKNKMRLHFHAFMQLIHTELKKYQGQKEPLAQIASDLAKKTMVLCFDEFFVSDIADAMLLGRLLEALFERGVSLVTTSNVEPDQLYKNGLQRQHFLPAIALLKKHLEVLPVKVGVDYRLRHLKQAGVFYYPNDAKAQVLMEQTFALLTAEEDPKTTALELFGRPVPIYKEAAGVVWFDFKVLCGVPRSQLDYLELVKKYHTLFLSNLPILEFETRDRMSSFIKLIDVLYDAKTRLVLSAAVNLDKIYSQGRLYFEYQRTLSRLKEMESESYFLK